MVNYSITILLGTVTIFGIVIRNEHVLFLAMISIIVTSCVVMAQILYRCYLRNRRMKNIDIRRSIRNGNATTR